MTQMSLLPNAKSAKKTKSRNGTCNGDAMKFNEGGVRRAFGRAPASRAAKAEGKYKGRVPTAQRKAAEVVQLRGQGVKPEAIAEKLGISRASVFRVLRDQRTPGRLSEG